jgi:hypothetical protein
VGPEFQINIYTTAYQQAPAVGANPAGGFVVVWSSWEQDGSVGGVIGRRYAGSGVPVGPEFLVNTYTTSFQGSPAVDADGSGNFVVVWASFEDGSFTGVSGQRYASTGAPLGTEFRINTYTTDFQGDPGVSSDASGNFVVVWTSARGAADTDVIARRYASTGVPLSPEFRVNTYAPGVQAFAVVASDPSGNFVVVWQSADQDDLGYGIFGQRYASTGVPLGPEFRVNTYTTNSQTRPAIASDVSGNFVVVWESLIQDAGGQGVFGQRFSAAGAPLGSEFAINTYTTNMQRSPSVGLDTFGNFVVAWMSNTQDGSVAGIFGQRYANTGSPLGPEFRINSYTAEAQMEPSVSVDDAGNFVVVWQSYLQDGSGSGVFGQRYSQIVPVDLTSFKVE